MMQNIFWVQRVQEEARERDAVAALAKKNEEDYREWLRKRDGKSEPEGLVK